MNITLFNRKYFIRRFGEQQEINGYITTSHTDFVVSIHIHPARNSVIQALPEGERATRRLEGHNCGTVLRAGNHATQQKGDFLFYKGEWYECVSVTEYDHTLLSHVNYQFTLVPSDGAGSIDVGEPPQGNPETWEGGNT